MDKRALAKLTTEEKRVKIAEACGIQIHFPYDDSCASDEQWLYRPSTAPDYLNDLNAMHEAEKILTPEQQCQYVRALMKAATSPSCSHWDCAHATAEQRADAFLLIMEC